MANFELQALSELPPVTRVSLLMGRIIQLQAYIDEYNSWPLEQTKIRNHVVYVRKASSIIRGAILPDMIERMKREIYTTYQSLTPEEQAQINLINA